MDNYYIVLHGQPKSTQHCYKYTCRGNYASMYMDKTCKDIKEGYTWEARSQYKGTPLPGPLFVCATLYHKSNRVVDIDNFNKLAFDALTGIVWEDDSQITDYYTKKRIDKTNPRIEFIITPYE